MPETPETCAQALQAALGCSPVDELALGSIVEACLDQLERRTDALEATGELQSVDSEDGVGAACASSAGRDSRVWTACLRNAVGCCVAAQSPGVPVGVRRRVEGVCQGEGKGQENRWRQPQRTDLAQCTGCQLRPPAALLARDARPHMSHNTGDAAACGEPGAE